MMMQPISDVKPAMTLENAMTFGKSVSAKKPLDCFHGFHVKPAVPDFVLHNEIGRGSFGVVHKGTCRMCSFNISVKEVEAYPKKPDGTELELRNLMYVKTKSHPNIIRFFGSVDKIPKRLFVFEIGDMSLEQFSENNSSSLSVTQFNEILFQLFSMLCYLDEVQLYHGDFQLRNMIVFFEEGLIKLIDFGKSKRPGDKDFKPPLSDLKVAAGHLAELQLMMLYKSKNQNYDLALEQFFYYEYREELMKSGKKASTPETLLSDPGNWLPELPEKTRNLLINAFSLDIQEQKAALTAGQSINPREMLKVVPL